MNRYQKPSSFVMKKHRSTRLAALEQLFSDHRKVLDAFISQRAAKLGVEAEDITQELFTRLADKDSLLKKMQKGEISSRPYLITMANNLLVDMARRKGRSDRYEDGLRQELSNSPNAASEPESATIAENELGFLKNVLMELKPNWRHAFVLNRFGNLTYREIALHMGVSEKQVENFMARALVRIRKAQEELDR